MFKSRRALCLQSLREATSIRVGTRGKWLVEGANQRDGTKAICTNVFPSQFEAVEGCKGAGETRGDEGRRGETFRGGTERCGRFSAQRRLAWLLRHLCYSRSRTIAQPHCFPSKRPHVSSHIVLLRDAGIGGVAAKQNIATVRLSSENSALARRAGTSLILMTTAALFAIGKWPKADQSFIHPRKPKTSNPTHRHVRVSTSSDKLTYEIRTRKLDCLSRAVVFVLSGGR